jgi:tetratricopeptide (TPR) repeat protein
MEAMPRVHSRTARRINRTGGLLSLQILAALWSAVGLAQAPGPSKAAAESWERGETAKNNRQWVECIENLTHVTQIDIAFLDAYLNLAYCQSEMQQWGNAARTYEKALGLNPPDSVRIDILTGLAFAQASAKDLPAAIKTYEDLIKLRPNDKSIMVGYAYTLKTMGREVDAVMAYLRALELDPSDVSIIKVVGELSEKNNMLEQAMAAYERWIAVDPENVEPYRYLAFLLYQAESCDRGVQVYEKAIALDPSNPGDILNLGLLYQKCKQYEKAMAKLQQYRAMRPDSNSTAVAVVDCRLAFLYEDMNKVSDGIAFVRDAGEKSPDDPCLQYAWGRLLEKHGLALVGEEKFDDGVGAYRQAQAKLTSVVGNPQWGESASNQLKRLEQLIKIAEAKKQAAEAE